MSQQKSHVMLLVKTYPSGADEWYCPTCGRRFLMQWPPKYKKIILETGDENASHSCGKGGVSIQSPEVLQKPDNQTNTAPDLTVWEEWLNKLDFDSWWDREI
jgi:hypothetical protein